MSKSKTIAIPANLEVGSNQHRIIIGMQDILNSVIPALKEEVGFVVELQAEISADARGIQVQFVESTSRSIH